jgi:predicted transcriptional regulator
MEAEDQVATIKNPVTRFGADGQNAGCRNVEKMTENVEKMTENVEKMSKNVEKMIENVEFV